MGVLERTGPEVPPDIAAAVGRIDEAATAPGNKAEPVLGAAAGTVPDDSARPAPAGQARPGLGGAGVQDGLAGREPNGTAAGVPDDLAGPAPGHAGATVAGGRALEVPTQQLPVIAPRAKVEARAVIVYQPEPRRKWGLWVFTGLIVALTVGVVLGQTAAYQPPAVATTPPGVAAPPAPVNVPTAPVTAPAVPVTAPLGAAKTARLEVTGVAEVVLVRTAPLGDTLFSAAAPGAVNPVVRDTSKGPRVSVAVSGPGTAEIVLHSAVRWTILLAGSASRQDADLRAGGVAGLELAGGAAQVATQLPRPAGRIPIKVTGAIGDLRIDAGRTPAGLHLTGGADAVTLAEREHRAVAKGKRLWTPGWKTAKARYDIEVPTRPARITVVNG